MDIHACPIKRRRVRRCEFSSSPQVVDVDMAKMICLCLFLTILAAVQGRNAPLRSQLRGTSRFLAQPMSDVDRSIQVDPSSQSTDARTAKCKIYLSKKETLKNKKMIKKTRRIDNIFLQFSPFSKSSSSPMTIA